jgi:hypothetical protein
MAETHAELAELYAARAQNAAMQSFTPAELLALAQVNATLALVDELKRREPLESYAAGYQAGRAAEIALAARPCPQCGMSGGWHRADPLCPSQGGVRTVHTIEPGVNYPEPWAVRETPPVYGCVEHGWLSTKPCPEHPAKGGAEQG